MDNLRREEQVGLAVAVALHAALFGLLALPPAAPPMPLPQRISVTLSRDIGLDAAAPTHAAAAADQAPTLGAPPAPDVSPPPARVVPPVAKTAPAPDPVAVAPPRAVVIDRPGPEAAKPPAKSAPKSLVAGKHSPSVKDWDLAAPATPDHQPAGASRIGDDFLKGVAGGKAAGKARQQGAAVIGPEVKSSLSGAIAQQLKPHWAAPQGVDADKLITILAWDLNRDGSLAGTPRVVRQEGITDGNSRQAARHAEQAIRAVELAAPFRLPREYYAVWKRVAAFTFNRSLSQ